MIIMSHETKFRVRNGYSLMVKYFQIIDNLFAIFHNILGCLGGVTHVITMK